MQTRVVRSPGASQPPRSPTVTTTRPEDGSSGAARTSGRSRARRHCRRHAQDRPPSGPTTRRRARRRDLQCRRRRTPRHRNEQTRLEAADGRLVQHRFLERHPFEARARPEGGAAAHADNPGALNQGVSAASSRARDPRSGDARAQSPRSRDGPRGAARPCRTTGPPPLNLLLCR